METRIGRSSYPRFFCILIVGSDRVVSTLRYDRDQNFHTKLSSSMIQLSPTAIAEVNRIKEKQANPQAYFRLGVQPGGCAEWHYTLGLTESIAPDDRVITCSNLQVVVDAASWQYLDGLAIDYTEDLMGGGFRFQNPNATSNCGCGNSFAA